MTEEIKKCDLIKDFDDRLVCKSELLHKKIVESIIVQHPTLPPKIKIQYDSSLQGEARAKVYHGKILLGEKFFDLPSDIKKHVLTHEFGHFFEHEVLKPEVFWKVSDSGILGSAKKTRSGSTYFEGVLGTSNAGEALAEAYAVYRLAPKELLNRYPKVYGFIQEIERGKTTEKALEKTIG